MLRRVPCRTSRTGLLRSARRTRHIIARCCCAFLRSARSGGAVRCMRSRRLGCWLSCGTLVCRLIRRSCLFGWYTGAKCSRFRSGCDCRLALVHGNPLLRVRASRLFMLSLCGYGSDMFLVDCRLLLSGRTRCDPTGTAVVADPVHRRIVDHCGVVGVVNVGDVHVIHRAVVFELSVVPAATLITFTAVTEAVIDPAIETDLRTPVAFIESKSAATPAPIAWSPEETGLRSHDPRTWHKEVTAVTVRPVARCPEITLGRDGRLLVHRQRRRTN